MTSNRKVRKVDNEHGEHLRKERKMSEIFPRDFYRMQDEIDRLNEENRELRTELENAEWINDKNRKEIDRLNEQIKRMNAPGYSVSAAYDLTGRPVSININQVEAHYEYEYDWITNPLPSRTLMDQRIDLDLDLQIGSSTQQNIKLADLERVIKSIDHVAIETTRKMKKLEAENIKLERENKNLKADLDKKNANAYTLMERNQRIADLTFQESQLRSEKAVLQREKDNIINELEELVRKNDESEG